MTRLPVLEDVRIPALCDADWDALSGDGATRFCGMCQLQVHDLSAMSRSDGEALLATTKGRLCVRMARPKSPRFSSLKRVLAQSVAGVGLVFGLQAYADPPAKEKPPAKHKKHKPKPQKHFMGAAVIDDTGKDNKSE